MKKSRKGIYLNDAQCFNQPLPHTRKKMTKMQIIQFKKNFTSDEMSVKKKNIKENVRIHRSNGLDKDQPSTEMALVTYTKTTTTKNLLKYNINNNNSHHDVSVIKCNPDQNADEEMAQQSLHLLLKKSETINIDNESIKILDLQNNNNNEKNEIKLIKKNNDILDHASPSKQQENKKKKEEEEEEEEDVIKITEIQQEKYNNNNNNNNGDDDDDNDNIITNEKNNNIIKTIKKNDETKQNKNDEKLTWWKLIIDFFGFFWSTNETSNDKQKTTKKQKKNRRHDIKNMSVTEKPENTDIYKNYISSRDKTQVKDNNRQRKIELKQTSSPLY